MTRTDPLTISAVEEGSIAWRLGIEAGDSLISINGSCINDIIDYYLLSGDRFFQMEIRKPSGELCVLEVKNHNFENLGLTFIEDIPGGLRQCSNKCIFCFVDQLPEGLRETLYVKDDDYRHSFLYGNYISLTNLSRADWERIIRMRLSPLYVSVHTTNPRLRGKIFGNANACRIMEQLRELVNAGITLYIQIVVCPGTNDGQELENTLRDLGSFWPSVASVAVVPVGVTKFQRFEYPFFPVDRLEALDIIHQVEKIQQEFRETHGSNIVFAADELYLKAGRPIPPAEYYEDFGQLENGVGLVRMFLDDLECLMEELPPSVTAPKRKSVVITGISAAPVLDFAASSLEKKVPGLDIEVLAVENNFFGPLITVAGLLVGKDISDALEKYEAGDKITAILPSVTLKAGEEVFLDDLTVEEIQESTGIEIKVVENSAKGLVEGILDLEV